MRRSQLSNLDYLSRETGSHKKKWKGKLPVALLFPNFYRLGMSNLGFQLVYHLINANPDVVCERVFYPETSNSLLSVESSRPLRDFPVIICSVSFEQDFLNLIKMLDLGDVEPLAEKRGEVNFQRSLGDPLVIGGGVATFINPEPLAPFIDLFVVGEAEPVLPSLLDYLLNQKGSIDRESFLQALVKSFAGCYAPRFYTMEYDTDGILTGISVKKGIPSRVKKVISLSRSIAGHSQILTPDTEFSSMFLTELGRGCSRGCRFCAAGFVYRPPRLWEASAIVNALEQRPSSVDKVGLLGMEMACPEVLGEVAEYLLEKECSLSFSSLRADALSPSLVRLLGKSGLKSSAIAPDGGSERLRRVINKGIVEDDVLMATELLVKAGVSNLKLYFMIGLPTETQEDLNELVDLVFKIKEKILAIGRSKGRLSNITLSINSFVPKAWTPFQFHPFAPLKELKNKIKFLRQKLANQPNIKVMIDRPENAFFQATLARGDRRVGEVLLSMVHTEKGWRQVFKQQGICPEDYAMRQRGQDELFPWEIIDHGINRQYLWKEYQKALSGKLTSSCDVLKCKRCGVCNG